MIPIIDIKTKWMVERTYAQSLSQYDYAEKVELVDSVNLEYAAFLINEGELRLKDYVMFLELEGVDVDLDEINKAIENDKTTWEDWVC